MILAPKSAPNPENWLAENGALIAVSENVAIFQLFARLMSRLTSNNIFATESSSCLR